MQSESRGYKLLLGNILVLTIFYLGVDFVLRRWQITTEQVLLWGWGGSVILLMPFFVFRKKSFQCVKQELKHSGKLLTVLALITVIANLFFIWGMSLSGSGPAVLLENMQPVFALLLGVCFLAEQLTFRESIAALLMFGGVLLIGTLKGEVPLSSALAITFSSFLFAAHSFLIKRHGQNMKTIYFAFLRGCMTAFLILIGVVVMKKLQMIPFPALLILAVVYTFGILVSRYLFFEAHKHLPISKINLSLLLQPVTVVIGAWLIFGDPISLQKIIGATLILGGGYLFAKSKKKELRKTPQEC